MGASMASEGKDAGFAEVIWAVGLAIVASGLLCGPLRAQSLPTQDQAQSRQGVGDGAVVCFAGCSGRAGQVIARPDLPPLPDGRPQGAAVGWRPAGMNNWCHDKLGCRTRHVQESPPKERNRRQGVYCSTSYNGMDVCRTR